jgi:DNA-binding transcriptional LysR family regulator
MAESWRSDWFLLAGRPALADTLPMPELPRNYFKELRLQQFRGLVALAQWKTFSGAAAALKLSRTSVWQQVHALEAELCSTLVRTSGSSVHLTAEGEKLVEMVSPLVAGFDSVKEAFSSVKAGLLQTLVIATAPTFLIYELSEPISRIHALYPKLHLSFLERNSPVALELLEQGGADLAVAALPAKQAKKATLEYTQITAYPFTLICPPGHPLLAKQQVILRDLTRYPLITSSNVTFCRQHFNSIMNQAALLEKINIILESNFPVLHFEYVRMGLGVALAPLPPSLVRDGVKPEGIALRSVAQLLGEEPLYLVRRKGEFATPYATTFCQIVTGQLATTAAEQRIAK